MILSGWGRFPKIEAPVAAPRSEAQLIAIVRKGTRLIARGNGRAYGDSAIAVGRTVDMRHFNRMISFNASSGQLIAEAGITLAEIIETFLPRGWFPAVTPGTKFVTLGGMVAADVHGKNHHKVGSFRSCLDWVDIINADGEIQRCSRECDFDLFDYTVGGMGLTGIILRAAIRLLPVDSAWVQQSTRSAPNLADAMAAFEAADEATYSVAWIDCLSQGEKLGRSLIMLGEHASRDEVPAAYRATPYSIPSSRKRTVPVDLPSFALNRYSVRLFNELYYWRGSQQPAVAAVPWDSFFYPLDGILGWNRIYGRRGFAQFQCVLPLHSSEAGLTSILKATSAAGAGSFLAVLKRFGKQSSAFSFPTEGYTLALDFPVNQSTLRLLDTLDRITLEHGGRFYLAKDSRMTAKTLAASDRRTETFREARRTHAWASKFNSAQSERLAI